MIKIVSAVAALVTAGATAVAAEALAPASQRFASDSVTETPDFQKHILPLMGRVGCNGRACHGSFQGRGGFRLSLFGYDFKSDHEAIAQGDYPRVNLEVPAASKILEKATEEIPHEGGKRFEKDSWQYNMIAQWIKSGAKGVPDDGHQLKSISVSPAEIIWDGSSEPIQVRVLATWEDGATEDVTCISRFRTNDESVAEVDEDGVVRIVGKGDTHIVAFYDNGVAVIPVMRAVTDLVGDKYPKVETSTKIDALVVDKLKKIGVVPSELCTDAEFLRRVSLDVTGTLPTPKEVEAFLTDRSPDKRGKKVNELLDTPAYAAWWATKLCDITGNNTQNLDPTFRQEQGQQWYDWIKARLEKNVPYDEMVAGIVLAVSRKPGQSYEEYCKEMRDYYAKDGKANFADRETMPHFWTRRTIRRSEDKALNFAYTFLGVRLECAQCHKHPFDQWTQQDFNQFTAFFDRITYANRPRDKEGREFYAQLEEKLGLKGLNGGDARRTVQKAAREGELVPVAELTIAPPRQPVRNRGKNNRQRVAGSRTITPKLLGGEEVLDANYDDPRTALMEWMRDEDNPYFARAWVNRVWAHYFGVGVIEPPDDQNLANPPSNKPLLDYLAKGFVESGFDMKWLHREITLSDAYQRSWKPNDTNVHDTRNFSRASIRRLPAEVAYDAVRQATAGSDVLAVFREDLKDRAIALANVGLRRGRDGYALEVFGKPDRTTTCDCERSNDVNLVQSIFLRNDQDLIRLMEQRDGWLQEVGRKYGLVRDPKAEQNEDRQRQTLATLDRQLQNSERQLNRARKQKNEELVEKLEQQIKRLQRQHTRIADQLDEDKKTVSKDGAIVLAKADREQVVREAYLRTLNRPPRPEELERASQHLGETGGIDGVRDLLWSLINTKEFIVNH